MKKAKKLAEQNRKLKVEINQTILVLLRKHFDLKKAVEFPEDIIYEDGQDNHEQPFIIETVTISGIAVIEHEGFEVQQVPFEQLSTETQIEIVEGLEQSLKSK